MSLMRKEILPDKMLPTKKKWSFCQKIEDVHYYCVIVIVVVMYCKCGVRYC
jgi:hypothetical protein